MDAADWHFPGTTHGLGLPGFPTGATKPSISAVNRRYLNSGSRLLIAVEMERNEQRQIEYSKSAHGPGGIHGPPLKPARILKGFAIGSQKLVEFLRSGGSI